MIYKNIHPVNMVEDEGFKNLMKYIEPGYVMPSRKTLTEKYIPAIYGHFKIFFFEYLSEVSSIGLTWTSQISTISFLTITARIVTEKFKKINFVLGHVFLKSSHTGKYIFQMMLNHISKEWNSG